MRSKRPSKGGRDKDSRNEKGGSRRGESSRREPSAGGGSRRGDGQRGGGRDRSAKGIVLEMFSNSPDTVFTQRQMTRKLGIVDKKGRDELMVIVNTLLRENKLLLIDGDKYQLNLRVNIITGRVDLANSKYAYIVSEETEDDVRVFREHLKYAMDGDLVKVKVLPTMQGGRSEGMVVEVLERSGHRPFPDALAGSDLWPLRQRGQPSPREQRSWGCSSGL